MLPLTITYFVAVSVSIVEQRKQIKKANTQWSVVTLILSDNFENEVVTGATSAPVLNPAAFDAHHWSFSSSGAVGRFLMVQ